MPNQNKPATVDEYIAQQPEEYRERLEQVRRTIRETAPDASEMLKWSMPTYYQTENLIHFAFHKDHLGVYPGPDAIEEFTERFNSEGYEFSKGAVRFPWKDPVPFDLIVELTRARVKAVKNND